MNMVMVLNLYRFHSHQANVNLYESYLHDKAFWIKKYSKKNLWAVSVM